jgi:hypothetical protein
MIYCQSYFIQARVPTILYVIWFITSLTSYRIEYPTILYVIWYINISYDIQYDGVLYPVWSKTENISYDIQYDVVLYPVWSSMSYDTLSVLLQTG